MKVEKPAVEFQPTGEMTVRDTVLVRGVPSEKIAAAIERHYFSRLGSLKENESGMAFRVGIPVVQFGPAVNSRDGDRETWTREIQGGLLAKEGGQFVILLEPNPAENTTRVTVELKDFKPMLPLWIYKLTQLPIHRLYTQDTLRVFPWRHFLEESAPAKDLDLNPAGKAKPNSAAVAPKNPAEH